MERNRKLRLIIEEWFDYSLPEFNLRDFDYSILEANMILALVGPRRAGKTYILFQLIKYLRDKGIPQQNILYFNFEDERIFPLDSEILTDLIPIYLEVVEVDKNEKIYLFLDEIQVVPYWDKWLRRVFDMDKRIRLIITGSSSSLLSREISGALGGRVLSIRINPLNFREFLRFKGVSFELTGKNRRIPPSLIPDLKRYLHEYLEHGGFPEIVLEKNPVNKRKILQGYFQSIYYADLIRRFEIRRQKLMGILMDLLVDYSAKKISFSKIHLLLRSMGFKASKTTIIEFSGYLREVFLFFYVQIMSYSIKDRMQYPKKVYCIDNGIINHVSLKFREEKWVLYENIVFLELYRRGFEIFYWKDAKHEVDFVVKNPERKMAIIQVAMSISERKARDREIKGLVAAMDAFNINEGLIITEDTEELVTTDNGKKIRIIPLFKWLLDSYSFNHPL